MAYELTETEKRMGAIPEQMTEGAQMLSDSERRVRAIAADRPAYTPQFGSQGAVSQAPERQIEQADVQQQAITGAFKPNQRISANVEKQYGPQGELLGYVGRGTGRPSPAQQERDKEMAGRGMTKDIYGNWAAPKRFEDMTLMEAATAIRDQRRAQYEKSKALEAAQNAPYREAQIEALKGQTALAKTQRGIAELGAYEPRAKIALMKQLERTDISAEDRTKFETALKEINERAMRQKIAIEIAKQNAALGEEVEFTEGGLVRGYAGGGAVSRDLAQPAPQVNPLIAQYGQYLTAAASAGVPPVPFAQYQNLLQTTRTSMQGQPPVGFADGGDVSALGRTLEGPGTSTSDSIPAVIDGKQPAALSKDEFVFPAEVTKYYGTKFMIDLIAKAKAALSGEGLETPAPQKTKFADGGV